MPKSDLAGKVLYNSKNTKSKYTEVGAQTVVDILFSAGVISEDGDAYVVPKGPDKDAPATTTDKEPNQDAHEAGGYKPSTEPRSNIEAYAGSSATAASPPFQVAINIQIQIQEFEDTSKYDAVFEALKKHLWSESL